MKIPKKLIELSHKDDGRLAERALKLCEEAGEVAEASLRLIGRKSRKGHSEQKLRDHVVEEVIDVIVMSMDLLTYMRYTNEKNIEKFIKLKLKKWQASIDRDPNQNRRA